MPIVKHLVADQFGTAIGKYSQRLKITQKGKTLAQAPLMHLEDVSILSRGVSISSDALAACTERGIPVYFLSSRGEPYASIYSAGLTGTVLTRREQLRAYDDARSVHAGIAFACGKIENQSATLKYLAKNRKDTPEGQELRLAADEVRDYLHTIEQMQDAQNIEQIRERLMGAEGNAARCYWQAVRAVLPSEYGWSQRVGRGATDPINSLLNYGYGILYGQVERALVLAGLDPFAGFVHADRPGKPSLVLDLIEEFRQSAVDRVVFGLANRHFKVDQDEKGRMSEHVRQTFAEHIINHLDSQARYRGQQHTLRQIIQMQARQLVTFLRQERERYVPFKASW